VRPEFVFIGARVARLVDIQVAAASREAARNAFRTNVAQGVAFASILLGICVAGLIAIMALRLFDDLRRSYARLEEAQTALVAREKGFAVGELAAVVAHEVRNPLGVIFNCVSTLRRGNRPETPVVLEILQEEADRIDRIVKNMLDLSRPQKLLVRSESMSAILTGARQQVEHRASAAGVELCVDVSPDLPMLADFGLFNQALVNLMLNAIEAAPRGGHVRVCGSIERTRSGGAARVDIFDDGAGISPEDQTKIFQPFFTTKATGTGLGLALVRRVVEAHGGEIRVESSVGEGTHFTVVLPAEPRATIARSVRQSEVRPSA
jgi:signal transduction histidine kinase